MQNLAVLKQLASWPKLVESAALAHEPHRIAFYLVDLYWLFSQLVERWARRRVITLHCGGNQAVTDARLMLVKATSLVIRTGLNILSITALDEM